MKSYNPPRNLCFFLPILFWSKPALGCCVSAGIFKLWNKNNVLALAYGTYHKLGHIWRGYIDVSGGILSL